jgi:hypothetical protein
MALAENAGLSPITELSEVKARQIKEKNPYIGVDCMQSGVPGEELTPCGGAWRQCHVHRGFPAGLALIIIHSDPVFVFD